MNNILRNLAAAFLCSLLIAFPLNIHAQDCFFSSSGSSNGACANASIEITCSDGMSCSFSWGACDYGDVIISWFSGACNQ